MLRTCLVIGFGVLSLTLSVGNLAAQDSSSSIVFTGCPPFVEGSHCDSLYYQVVAVDLDAGNQRPGIVKYLLVSGPGTVDERTGLWELNSERDSVPSNYYGEVEIAAYKGNDTTSGDENCRFEVRLFDEQPYFHGYCGAHITVLPGETITIPLEITEADWCDDPVIDSAIFFPEPTGLFAYDASAQTVRFEPDTVDQGTSFEVRIVSSSGSAFRECTFWFDVFVPEPVRFRIASIDETEVRPGDTVLVDLQLEEASVEFNRVGLTIGYDALKLQLVDIEAGSEFFADTALCGWELFDWSGPSLCSYSEPTLVRLTARATLNSGAPYPLCVIPQDLPATFATMKFVIMDSFEYGEQFAPVDFYWCRCQDNYAMDFGVRPQSRYEWYLPSHVYTPDGELIPPDTIPGYAGMSDQCYYYEYGGVERYRLLELHNGGVSFSLVPPEATYSVRIGFRGDVFLGTFEEVPITLEEFDHTQGLAGFDFLVAYDASALAFQSANEGDLYDSCGWEYFTYRYGPYGDCGEACPDGILRIIGLAETNNGPYHPNPDCATNNPGWVSTVPVTLATMRFLVSNDRNLECQFVPVRFFWYNCGNNAMTSRVGSERYLSLDVFEFGIANSIAGDQPFPTFRGAQKECLASGSIPLVNRRAVDFYNGGLGILCGGWVDTRGDINLNGIAFEIADGVMFSDYFLKGLSAFGTHIEGSIVESDVNEDGISLAVADLVYLYRVITGDPSTIPSAGGNCPNIELEMYSQGIALATSDSLGGACFVVDGLVTPTFLGHGAEMRYHQSENQTRILIVSYDAGSFFSGGPLLSFDGPWQLVSVEISNYSGLPCDDSSITVVEGDDTGSLPAAYGLHPNYPNPFNPTTLIRYDLPEQSSVRITVYNTVGQLVRTLVDRQESPGQHETIWDGRDDAGHPVSSGLYLYRMTAGDFTHSRKMLLLK